MLFKPDLQIKEVQFSTNVKNVATLIQLTIDHFRTFYSKNIFCEMNFFLYNFVLFYE